MPHHRSVCIVLLSLLIGCQEQSHKEASSISDDVKLVSGLGPVHMTVSTAHPEAQKFFDQGLAYIYAFNHDEAVRAFTKAGQLDPKLAMAHWGRACALGPNINLPEIDEAAAKAAYDAAQQAVSLSKNATEKERAYIQAIALRYPADPKGDFKKPAFDYAQAMGKLSKKYPDDLDAATLYAESMMNLRPWKLYDKNGNPEPGTLEIVATLEWVMKRNPNHTGANHYYIHATEASTDPGRAIDAAKRLPVLAPNAGHLVHMPAHVWIRTGDYAAAIKANADAARVDEKFISCCGPRGKGGIYPALYYSHNLHFLAVAAAMAGRTRETDDALERLARHLEPLADENPIAEGFAAMPTLIMVRQGQWEKIMKLPRPKANRHATTTAWHFARGMAFAAKKEVGQALAEHEAMTKTVKPAAGVPMGNNTAGQVFAVADQLLMAKIMAARGDQGSAKRAFELAVKAQDDLAYDEPPAFPWPVREALGGYLVSIGDGAGAEAVFREDLKRTLNNPRSLLGLAEALKLQARPAKAEEAMKDFQSRWTGAEVQLVVKEF